MLAEQTLLTDSNDAGELHQLEVTLHGVSPYAAPQSVEWQSATPVEFDPALIAAQPENTTQVSKETSLVESMAYLMLLSVLQRVIGLGRGVLVCMWLTPALLGPWDLANRFFFLAAPLTVIGLPGSFGRYLEYYRQRGALRAVLKRTAVVCAVLSFGSWSALQIWPAFFADLFFGHASETGLLRLSASCLVAVIAYNYLTEMLTALRMVKLNAVLQFANTLIFTVLSIALLAGWRADAAALIVAYGVACLALVMFAICSLRQQSRHWPADRIILPHRELWTKLLPFAGWVWLTNLLTNLFESSGRYMILHYSGIVDKVEVDALIGNYHAALLVPNLMITMASMLGGTLLPYLSRDWEQGRQDQVSQTMKLAIKLISLLAVVGSLVVLGCSSLLFQVALRDKYHLAPQILNYTLACSGWAAVVMVTQMYLWCAERAKIGCLSLLAGLIVNVTLSYYLLPSYGLQGSVIANAFGCLTLLGVLYQTCIWYGLKLDRQTALVSLLPGLLLLGFWPALIGLSAVLCLAVVRPESLFHDSERAQFRQLLSNLRTRWS